MATFKKRALTLATLGILGAATPFSAASLGHNQRQVITVDPEVPVVERVVSGGGGVTRIDYAQKPAEYFHRSTLSLALISFTNNEFHPAALNEQSFISSASFILVGDSDQSASHSNEHNSTLEFSLGSILHVTQFEPSAVEKVSTLAVTLASDTEAGFSEQMVFHDTSPNLFVELDAASRFIFLSPDSVTIASNNDLSLSSASTYEFEAGIVTQTSTQESLTSFIIDGEVDAEFIPAITTQTYSSTSRGVLSVVGVADYILTSNDRSSRSHTSLMGNVYLTSLTDAAFEKRILEDPTILLLLAAMYDDD
jgi:hypothetical protein